MTNLESHVVSLELAEQLLVAGYPQEGNQFYWVKDYDINNNFTGESPVIKHEEMLWYQEMEKASICAAPLASELGEQLKLRDNTDCFQWKPPYYDQVKKGWPFQKDLYQKEVDARAAYWLYLKQENLLPTPERDL